MQTERLGIPKKGNTARRRLWLLSAGSSIVSAVFWVGLWAPVAIVTGSVSVSAADIGVVAVCHVIAVLPALVLSLSPRLLRGGPDD